MRLNLLLIAALFAWGQEADFTIVHVPDTHIDVAALESTLTAQADTIINNAAAWNVKAIL